MKTSVFTVLLALFSVTGFCAPAPVNRNSWTTNVVGNPVRGQDNLSITNLSSGTNWQFYNVGPKTVARLADISNVVDGVFITTLNGIGTNLTLLAPSGGPSKALAVETNVLVVTNGIVFTTKMSSPTNIANFLLITDDFVLNQYYTNSNQRAYVQTTVTVAGDGLGAFAQISLFLDQNADGTWEQNEISAGTGSALGDVISLGGWVQPNGRFIFTNRSDPGTFSSINANSSQWIRQ